MGSKQINPSKQPDGSITGRNSEEFSVYSSADRIIPITTDETSTTTTTTTTSPTSRSSNNNSTTTTTTTPTTYYDDPPIDIQKIDRKSATTLQKSLALWLQNSQYRPTPEESWPLVKPIRNFAIGFIGGTFMVKPLLQQFLPAVAVTPRIKAWLLASIMGGYPLGFLATALSVRQSICELLQDNTQLAVQARYLYRVAQATAANQPPPSPPPSLRILQPGTLNSTSRGRWDPNCPKTTQFGAPPHHHHPSSSTGYNGSSPTFPPDTNRVNSSSPPFFEWNQFQQQQQHSPNLTISDETSFSPNTLMGTTQQTNSENQYQLSTDTTNYVVDAMTSSSESEIRDDEYTNQVPDHNQHTAKNIQQNYRSWDSIRNDNRQETNN